VHQGVATAPAAPGQGRLVCKILQITTLTIGLSTVPVLSEQARAATFNLVFDGSTASAPAGFFAAFNQEIQYFETIFNDPITINLHVGWGDINGGPLSPGNVGQSLTNQVAVPYTTLKGALVADAKSAADTAAVASLPAIDPTPGKNFAMSTAEAKALGLLPGMAAATDGWVGFNKNVSYAFDPTSRSVAGAYDFFGVADHEITEVMGRYGFGQNGSGSRDSPIDLFRFAGAGVRDWTPAFAGAANYFSIDGGLTSINTFNTACCGDLSDWAGNTIDPFNAFLTLGRAELITQGDLVEMDVLGYDRATVPEPATLALLITGLSALRVRRYGRR